MNTGVTPSVVTKGLWKDTLQLLNVTLPKDLILRPMECNTTTTNNTSKQQQPDRLVTNNPTPGSMRRQENPIGVAISGEPESYPSQVAQPTYVARPLSPYGVRQLSEPELFSSRKRAKRAAEKAARDRADQEERERSARPSEQWANSRIPVQPNEPPSHVHNALWGSQAQPPPR
ncbi:hypothetical protein EYC84_002530 [Monilinia fructicola]|nr:hypothetical protein EYC84_002530 [Monilinia fructicola]